MPLLDRKVIERKCEELNQQLAVMRSTASIYGHTMVPHVRHLYFKSTAHNNLLQPDPGAGDVSDLCQWAKSLYDENINTMIQSN